MGQRYGRKQLGVCCQNKLGTSVQNIVLSYHEIDLRSQSSEEADSKPQFLVSFEKLRGTDGMISL